MYGLIDVKRATFEIGSKQGTLKVDENGYVRFSET
jgi:hypothetical protein